MLQLGFGNVLRGLDRSTCHSYGIIFNTCSQFSQRYARTTRPILSRKQSWQMETPHVQFSVGDTCTNHRFSAAQSISTGYSQSFSSFCLKHREF